MYSVRHFCRSITKFGFYLLIFLKSPFQIPRKCAQWESADTCEQAGIRMGRYDESHKRFSRFIQTPLKIKSIKEILIHYLFKQFYSHLSALFIDTTLEVHLTSRKFRYQRLLWNIYVWLFQCINLTSPDVSL